MKIIKFITYNLFADKLDQITIDNDLVISTINPYSFLISEQDNDFNVALKESDILLPDGQGIVWATNLLYHKKIKKIAGYDIFIHLINALNKNNRKCFFLGSTNNTLNKIKDRLNIEFPNISTEFYSPPFKAEFNDDDNEVIYNKINTFKPDVLFIGMTAPKQEKWVYKNKDKINVNIIASIGAVFDFYAGNVKRPSQFWINIGLEWLIRFLQEPKRLFKRNMYSIVFIFKILKAKWKSRRHLTTDSTD